jgi:L,D-peptidoglycan transpeptidase YkuD (ErfK/YbiS/YcfS/YnhG family)
LWRRDGDCWVAAAGPWRADLGRTGVARNRREGDGTTPLGTFAFGPVMYGVGRDPGVRFRYHRLVCGDWWDEDPASPTYNTFRHVRCGSVPPFGGGSEALWRARAAYLHFAEIRFNSDPVVAGRGSAIFLHVSLGRPTNGCVALRRARLVSLLRRLRPDARPLITIRLAG